MRFIVIIIIITTAILKIKNKKKEWFIKHLNKAVKGCLNIMS